MVGCVVAHEGLGIFTKCPEEFVFNPKLDVVKTKTISIAVQCKHCEDALCLNACPSKAISRVDDAVVLNTTRCIGCKTCVLTCPYGAVNMVEVAKGNYVSNKCDFCVGRAEPECVKVCLTNSLKVVTEGTPNESKSPEAAAPVESSAEKPADAPRPGILNALTGWLFPNRP